MPKSRNNIPNPSSGRRCAVGKCEHCSYEITKIVSEKLYDKLMQLHLKQVHKSKEVILTRQWDCQDTLGVKWKKMPKKFKL